MEHIIIISLAVLSVLNTFVTFLDEHGSNLKIRKGFSCDEKYKLSSLLKHLLHVDKGRNLIYKYIADVDVKILILLLKLKKPETTQDKTINN